MEQRFRALKCGPRSAAGQEPPKSSKVVSNGKSHLEMDDDWGYPHDSGHLQMVVDLGLNRQKHGDFYGTEPQKNGDGFGI